MHSGVNERIRMKEEKILVLCLAGGVLILFLIITVMLFLKQTWRYPYRARTILTKREYQFYLLLQRETARRGLLICPKVGLKDLMEVTSRRNYMKYFHKIAQKHVDFVVCDRELRVLFAVELDDGSHDNGNARKRDQFKNQAFRAAKIPLKRIRDYDEASVRELFRGV